MQDCIGVTNTTPDKLEGIQCDRDLGRSRGIPNAAVKGELRWANIRTLTADRSLKYFIRIFNLVEGNWAKMVYSHLGLVENNIDTEWRISGNQKVKLGFNRGKK